jgi:hypothetical protein
MPKRADQLTRSAVANANPQAKPYKLPDGRGMLLLVNPDGSKLWRYRRSVTGTKTCWRWAHIRLQPAEHLLSWRSLPQFWLASSSAAAAVTPKLPDPVEDSLTRMGRRIEILLLVHHAQPENNAMMGSGSNARSKSVMRPGLIGSFLRSS